METEPDQAICCEIEGFSHTYKNHLAVDNISFTIGQRSIHGFVGPNGAGKTTTLKVLATLMKPQKGRVEVFGHNVARDFKAVRKKIGYMQDHFSMYRQMTVFEYLDFFGAAYGLSSGQRDKTSGDILTLTDLEKRRHESIKGLSRGMQQRVSLARALVHDPQLLLLDEPASGLDPRARIELMEILQELRELGKTIFISSHILSELDTLCDHVTIVDRGTVKYTGSLDQLAEVGSDGSLSTISLRLETPSEASLVALRSLSRVETVETVNEDPCRLRVHRTDAALDLNAVVGTVIEAGGKLRSAEEEQRQLNQAFMDLTEPGIRS
ncbi:MAG: ABC transporter ATP-binding protein [Verrucomicrobiota bacterium]